MTPKNFDIAGKRFGRLVVLGFQGFGERKNGRREKLWLCRCDCGKDKAVVTGSLHPSGTKSCGCLRFERCLAKVTTHGFASNVKVSPEYMTWRNIRARCKNPGASGYKYYGARGIKVCDRWQTFENFITDMGIRPEGRYSIERVDVNGDYSPENCIWLPSCLQNRNRRTSRLRSLSEPSLVPR